MKKIPLLSSLLCFVIAVQAQETNPRMDNISDKRFKAITLPVVNQLLLSVKKMEECPCAFLEGTLDLFSPNAYIEVSNIRGEIRKYKPLSYFRTINALKCGKDKIYRSMRFDYRPVSEEDGRVSRFNGSVTVSYKVTQTFIGWFMKDNKYYSDRTTKVISINIVATDGELEPKIIGITVETTEKCEAHDSSNTHP